MTPAMKKMKHGGMRKMAKRKRPRSILLAHIPVNPFSVQQKLLATSLPGGNQAIILG